MNPLAVHGMLVCRVHGKDHDLQKTISVLKHGFLAYCRTLQDLLISTDRILFRLISKERMHVPCSFTQARSIA